MITKLLQFAFGSQQKFIIGNITRHTRITKNPVVLDSFVSQSFGLMFERVITPHVLLFQAERKVSLHTFFVAGPIDVIFVNAQGRVCEIKEHLIPFSFYFPQTKAKCIIEVPEGTVKRTKTRVSDKIQFF